MPFPIEVSARDQKLSAVEEQLIREAVTSFERYGQRIEHCLAVVDTPHHRPGGEPVAWVVRLTLSIPGGSITINRRAQPTLREAIDEARRAGQRRLRDRTRRRAGAGRP